MWMVCVRRGGDESEREGGTWLVRALDRRFRITADSPVHVKFHLLVAVTLLSQRQEQKGWPRNRYKHKTSNG